MSGDQDMQSNFDGADVGARQNSSVDMEGYSLLPDIVWTPSTDMSNSQFGKVIFTNIREYFPTNEDLLCIYTITAGIEIRDTDRIALFYVGWGHISQVITWVPAAKHPWPNEELSVVFPASRLPAAGPDYYQFCYLSGGEVRGASVPFYFVHKPTGNTEEEIPKGRLSGIHAFLTSPVQINIGSTGGGHQPTMAFGHPQNPASSSTDCRNSFCPGPSSDEPLRANTAASDSSCSEVSSSEQYAPSFQSEQQNNMGSITVPSVYADDDMAAGTSTSQAGYNDNDDIIRNQILNLSPEIRRRFMEMEREKEELLNTVTTIGQENSRLKGQLTSEVQRNQSLIVTLRKSEEELGKQKNKYESNCKNTSVVITELENELDNHKMRIEELQETINEKDKTIAYYSQRYGAVNEHVIALGGLPLFPVFPGQPGYNDGQGELQEHVDIGASSDMQRQYVRTSRLPPFLAALRKTRNYYITFLSDKGDIQRKVFALSCTKLSLTRKLHSMKLKKESIVGLANQLYFQLDRAYRRDFRELARIMEIITWKMAEKAVLDYKAVMETDMIEEIKNRLKINRKNIYTVRAKAIDVFHEFLRMYNSSLEHNSGALQAQCQAQGQNFPSTSSMTIMTTIPNLTPAQAQAEVEHIQTLYTGLDEKFQNILIAIDKCLNNTYIWD